MTSLRLGVRTAAHAASLIFGAWWLVATSSPSPPQPAPDCFTGIANPTRLEVTLGSPTLVVSGSALPSCEGIDGLAANRTLVFDLAQGPRPEDESDCYGYDTQAVSGVNGLTLQPVPKEGAKSLTSASGVFVSPELAGCMGTLSLNLYPEKYPQSVPLTSPLDAGPDERWVMQRLIRSNRPSLCGGMFAERGGLTCGDGFLVASIRELPAP